MALISSNAYLSMENATDNAQYIYNFMVRNGASQNAALAVLGNMYAESTCNPGIWQNRPGIWTGAVDPVHKIYELGRGQRI